MTDTSKSSLTFDKIWEGEEPWPDGIKVLSRIVAELKGKFFTAAKKDNGSLSILCPSPSSETLMLVPQHLHPLMHHCFTAVYYYYKPHFDLLHKRHMGKWVTPNFVHIVNMELDGIETCARNSRKPVFHEVLGRFFGLPQYARITL